MKIDIDGYKKNGYIIIPDIISQDMIDTVRKASLDLKLYQIKNNPIGSAKPFGVPNTWRGIDMASSINNVLYALYTLPFMYNISSALLETTKVYLFNDQVVCKMPNEDFAFEPHQDNQYGPNPLLAFEGVFKTITCCWVIDDLNVDNGPISFLNKSTNTWETPYPKSGDLIVWDGNTTHSSTKNTSDNPRVLWLLIYSNTEVKTIPTVLDFFHRFHSGRFIV